MNKTYLPKYHPDYQQPTTDDIRDVLRRHELSGAKAGALLGVGSRAIRKWVGGEHPIPYSAWRLLLIITREVKPDKTDDVDTGLHVK